jgi:hypothetical protein
LEGKGSYIDKDNNAIVGSLCNPEEFCEDESSTDPVVVDHCEDIWNDIDEEDDPPIECDSAGHEPRFVNGEWVCRDLRDDNPPLNNNNETEGDSNQIPIGNVDPVPVPDLIDDANDNEETPEVDPEPEAEGKQKQEKIQIQDQKATRQKLTIVKTLIIPAAAPTIIPITMKN